MTDETIGTNWTSTKVRVRYAETDQMGVVYYANYLVWFEIGRTDFCSQHGFAYHDMEQQDGLYIMVAEARCRYKAPARYDDELEVRTRLTGMRRRVLIFGYEIYKTRTDELIAEGETVHVITDRDGRPAPCPTNTGNCSWGNQKSEIRNQTGGAEIRNWKLEIRNSKFVRI